ncbi:MAG: hypothetical protein PF961_22435 [Planctomycetota bacterium]|jgi:hypothetical protein|nr:hypothetical protein [Planctomycetota bacterium]
MRALLLALLISLTCVACGIQTGPQASGSVAAAGVELVGTWAFVMAKDDAEMAGEVLPDGTPLGFETTFVADGTGSVNYGEGEPIAFTWSRVDDGTLTQVFTLETGGTNEASYRIEDLGDGRIKMVNAQFPDQDRQVFLRR